ncbi:CRAL-TRIO domain-containing protein [Aphelenchoides bicaudatus]|nr:CRAL-TRIO domain-containing protein [Aphelenchoides bicaudatus]
MTRHSITAFGEPLGVDSQKVVNEVRLRINQPIHPNFDSDFNIYRFVLNAERGHNRKDVIENAAKALNQHLRLRKCLRLDELPDVAFDDNPLFKRRLLPCGKIESNTDNANRLLWFIEYETISVEYIAHGMKSSEACRYQFMQFEHMLRRVNQQEAATGKLSSLRHVVDMNNYEINPFTMLFVSSGTLSYYSQLFHYENYPELVYPIEFVNIAKWIHVPYKLIKAMMPAGFGERFRLHDGHFLPTLSSEINVEHIPTTLGGTDPERKCTPAEKLAPADYWKPPKLEIIEALETLHVSARRLKYFRIDVDHVPKTLSWYFTTDGDVYFGVYFEPYNSQNKANGGKHEKEDLHFDSMEMVYPFLKLTAKLVHEFDAIQCTRPGTYYVVFSNKHSWVKSRSVDLLIQLSGEEAQTKRCRQDGTLEVEANDNLHIVKHLKLEPHPISSE